MKIYLAQHGKCVPKETNPKKPLSNEGREETESVARFLSKCGVVPNIILHSTKLRAEQTAQIFSEILRTRAEQVEGIAPLDPPQKIIGRLEDGMMIVGHLPHLSLLVKQLVGAECAAFTYSGVMCLNKTEEGWRILWYITPMLARA